MHWMDWVPIIKPKKAMLKFRLPYRILIKSAPTKYLDDVIWLQSFARRSVTETGDEFNLIVM